VDRYRVERNASGLGISLPPRRYGWRSFLPEKLCESGLHIIRVRHDLTFNQNDDLAERVAPLT